MIIETKIAAAALALAASGGAAGWVVTDATPDTGWTSTRRYSAVRVHQGDTLTRIARTHGTSVGELLALNPQIHDPDMIHQGDQIRVP
jgi:LysM repeat protein